MSGVPNKAVFLSYASQDTEAAGRICDAMRVAGLEVWFDKNELVGGDAWDQKIRKQIKECALFVPVISANTQARPEGYFRLEWKLAVDRSHLMADDQPFLVPVVIDDTPQGAARVPDKFQEVQWTRLVLTETPTAFAERLQTLLRRNATEPGSIERRGSDGGKAEKRRPSLLWGTIVPIVGVVMGVAFAFKGMWGGRVGPSRPPREATNEAPAPALSEARQLIKRARELSFGKYDSTADDYAAAELLVKQALEKAPTDAEVWAVSALLNVSIRTRGFDHSSIRNENARSHAERALSLNAESVEGLYALGRWQRDNEPDPAVAEASFKKVLAKAPEHDGALLTLAIHYMRRGRFEEALPLYERAATRPGLKPLAFYNMFLGYFAHWKFADAERCIRESIAAQPSSNSLAGMAMWQLSAKGDARAAASTLSASDPSMRREPRSVWIGAFCDLARRAPDEALVTLQRLSDDFIQDNWFVGPKAYWMGRAHAQAGRPEAARASWEAGLEVVRARLVKTPDNLELRLAHGELLALLGRTEEAVREAKVVEESQTRWTRLVWMETPARIYAALGRAEDAVRLLPTAEVGKYTEVGWPLTAALMRIDPLWDRIRDEPAFQKKLAAAAAAEATMAAAVERLVK